MKVDGEKIKRLRESRGWSQKQFVEAMGQDIISKKTLARVETNAKASPRPSTVKSIADTLEVSVESLARVETYQEQERSLDASRGSSPYLYVKSSTAYVTLKQWTHPEPHARRVFQIRGKPKEIKIYDEYMYRRTDKIESIPDHLSRVKLDWRSSGIIGDVSGYCGTDVSKDFSKSRVITHADSTVLIYTISPGHKELNSSVILFNDLEPPHYLDTSIKTLDGVWTNELEIKVDFSEVLDTVFAREPTAEFLRGDDEYPKEIIEVHKEEGANI